MLEMVLKTAGGEVCNGLALVRPPGFLVGRVGPFGECVFNNIAVSVRSLQRIKPMKRIGIMCWSQVHSMALQQFFYSDQSILICSLHSNANPTGVSV